MKKTLLSMAAALLCASAASAATTIVVESIDMTEYSISKYDFNGAQKDMIQGDLTATDGTKVPFILKQETSNTSADGIIGVSNQMRIYKSYEVTLTAPAGFTIKQIVFECPTNKKNGAWQYCSEMTSSCGGNFVVSSVDSEAATLTWVNEAGVSAFVAVASNAQVRVNKLILSDEAGEIEIPDDPEPEVTKVASIAAFKAVAKDTKVEFTSAVSVAYQNGRYLYVSDATGTLLVYGDITTKYVNGDVIPAGFQGTMSVYNDMPQLASPVADTFAAGTAGPAVDPAEVSIDELSTELNATYVVLKNVSVTAVEGKDNNYTVSDGENEVLLFNQFTNAQYYDVVDVPTGDDMNVFAIVTVYKGAVQLYPVSVVDAASISDVMVDANAPVEYFNLQGVRVANPENGLYIRRQGSTVTKVLVK